jgi:glycosyltransferase involved in cell wall biosynthesis/SAM-dependent methyltransferase
MPEAATGGEQAEGVNLVGFLRAEFGQGEVARRLAAALERAGIPFAAINQAEVPHRQAHDLNLAAGREAPYDTNLLCLNAEHLLTFAAGKRREILEGRYSIGVWFWETNRFPDYLYPAFDLVDEVWAASDFVAHAIAQETWKPVVTFPLPVEVRPRPSMSRTELGLPPDRFLFLFTFDFFSTSVRKNPLGLIEAFRLAFEPGAGPMLLVKSINGERHQEDFRALREAAAEHPDIQLSDGYVTQEHMQALLATCDCYASLHRSEGFGLGLAEAMAFGKPTLATGYSGNLAFMDETNSYLVSYHLGSVPSDSGPYPEGATWADPDVEDAARLMRRVVEQPDDAHAKAARGRTTIERDFSPERSASFLEERLTEIRARPRHTGERRTHAERAAAFVSTGPSVKWSAPSALGVVGRLWRTVLVRAIRPYTIRQREFESSVANALLELEEVLYTPPYVADPGFLRTTLPSGVEAIGYQDRGERGAARAPYRSFEDTFRGPEERVRSLQLPYLSLVGNLQPVLDVGCGRGEFLDLLADAEIPASGVDLDPGMVEHTRAKGHDVELGDGLKRLDALAGSLGVVFAAQVIEHLSYTDLLKFFELSERALKPGGQLIAETVNPHSLTGFKTFWTDPSHRCPIFPEVAVAICQIQGFASAYAFFPGGSGNLERDRRRQTVYAVVATKPS